MTASYPVGVRAPTTTLASLFGRARSTWDLGFAALDGSRQATQERRRDARRDLDLPGCFPKEMTESKGLGRQVLERDKAFPETAHFAEQRLKPFLKCAGHSRDLLCRGLSLLALGLGGNLLFRVNDLGCKRCACVTEA
ncbi:hypothetical protein IVB18_34685 [Bradyrhizobium sp. 186]|uniref:hypothetical protein n=1 Tax=Bradyrhizobium sp. 186 TaxID=2782654 RepID=UPI0020013DF8|nr:hypothetical protein [Bradyrhizobium sp. 186]UPK33332.1 hypothetical protein IVB18_34685 [Bradyrhizobium sp. 186]